MSASSRLTSRVTGALIAGLAFGIIARRSGSPSLTAVAGALEPVGTLWVNAIRMTVIPLIIALLVRAIAGAAQPAGIGRLGARGAALAFGALATIAFLVALLVPALFRALPLDPESVAALRATASATPPPAEVPSLTAWIVSLVPVNPVRAAADGALLPLMVFVIPFACALRRVPAEPRRAVVLFFDGVAEATLQVVRWVLVLAPVGILALAAALGTTLGVAAAGALGYLVVVLCALQVVIGLALYPIVTLSARVPLRRFAVAAAPAQAVAFSARSSLASLPAMVDGATRLGVPAHVSGFVLPLAVSLFKLTAPTYWTVSAAFVARLYGVEFGAAQIAAVALASITLSLGSPGIPFGGLLIQAPLYAAVGLPVEGLGILIAADAIPDMFKTTLNVTGDMALVTVLGRPGRADPAPEPARTGVTAAAHASAGSDDPVLAYPERADPVRHA